MSNSVSITWRSIGSISRNCEIYLLWCFSFLKPDILSVLLCSFYNYLFLIIYYCIRIKKSHRKYCYQLLNGVCSQLRNPVWIGYPLIIFDARPARYMRPGQRYLKYVCVLFCKIIKSILHVGCSFTELKILRDKLINTLK